MKMYRHTIIKLQQWIPTSYFITPTLHSQPNFFSPLFSPSSSSSSSFSFLHPSSSSYYHNTKSYSWRNVSSSSSSIEPSRRCWNCNSTPPSAPFLVCASCRCVQPFDSSIDYFQIFGLERKFDIEGGSLEGKYKDWQKKLHPDLVHSKSESEKQYAAEQSAQVIDAYRTLKDSLSRAIYLMRLQGVHVDEEQTVNDPDMLAEVMEIRESIEDADSQGLKQLQTQVQEKLQEWSESFATAFKTQDTEEAINAIRRMTYYKRANEEITKRL